MGNMMMIFPISPSIYSYPVKTNRVNVSFSKERCFGTGIAKCNVNINYQKTITMENLINTHAEAFRAVFLFGKFDNVQARRVFVPIALFMASAILVFGHTPKF
jgi:hypothetical protein